MNLLRWGILIIGCFGFGLSGMADETQVPYRLTLTDALQTAASINLQVMMADARLSQAIARIAEAQAGLLPQVDGIVSGGRQTTDMRAEGIQFPGFGPHIGPYNSFDARPRVTIALFDPSAFERFQAAKKGENLSQAELEKTREDILALVADLFLDAQRKQQTVGLLQTLLEKDQMTYDLSEENLAEGTGTELDSNKSKSSLDQTKYLYSQAKLQSEDAILDLKAALQIPLDVPMVFIDDEEFLKKVKKEANVNLRNVTNADMVLASSQLEANQADQKAAYADFLPKVSGSADYGRLGESPDHGSNTYSVGLQVSVPIWEGGATQANLKEAKERVKESKENFVDASQQERVNIAKAHVAIVEAEDLRKAKIQNLRTLQKSLIIALHAEEIGSGTALEVMQAKAELASAEDEYNESQASWVMAHIDLLHAEGRLRDLIKKGE